MKYFDELILYRVEQPALFTLEEAKRKLHQEVTWYPPEYRDKDAIASEVVGYYKVSISELLWYNVQNKERYLLAVEFKERDENGKYFDYITPMDKEDYRHLQKHQEIPLEDQTLYQRLYGKRKA